MNIVHIGLGKTATTSLQGFVFSKLNRMNVVDTYNKKGVKWYQESNLARDDINLISDEGIIGWNPRSWQYNFENNKIFGKDSIILITVRSHKSWVRSMYLQQINIGNAVDPKYYLLSSKDYDYCVGANDKVHNLDSDIILDVDSFNLKEVVGLYKNYFKKTIVVPIENINKLDFIRELIAIDSKKLNILKKDMKHTKGLNPSFSSVGVRLSIVREKVASVFGLTTQSSHCLSVRGLIDTQHVAPLSKKELEREKFDNSFLKKMDRRIKGLVRWRWFMATVISKVFPKKYSLPNSTYFGKWLEENDKGSR